MATKDDQKVNNYHMVKTFIGQNKCIIFQWVTLFMTSDYAEARDNITTNGQRLPPLLNKKKAKIIPTKRDSCVKKKWYNKKVVIHFLEGINSSSRGKQIRKDMQPCFGRNMRLGKATSVYPKTQYVTCWRVCVAHPVSETVGHSPVAGQNRPLFYLKATVSNVVLIFWSIS